MMKLRSICVFAMSILLFTSCKDEKKTDETKNSTIEHFRVELDITAQKREDFTVYYTESGKDDYTGEKTVWYGVKGGNVDEKPFFDLPEEVIPTNIRLDFGISKDREDVIVKKVKFIFYENTFEIKGSEFLNYFIERKEIPTEIDTASGTIKMHTGKDTQYGAFYYPRQELLNKIAEITKTVK